MWKCFFRDKNFCWLGEKNGWQNQPIKSPIAKRNELLRSIVDFCISSVDVENKAVDVLDYKGNSTRILRMHVSPFTRVIAN